MPNNVSECGMSCTLVLATSVPPLQFHLSFRVSSPSCRCDALVRCSTKVYHVHVYACVCVCVYMRQGVHAYEFCAHTLIVSWMCTSLCTHKPCYEVHCCVYSVITRCMCVCVYIQGDMSEVRVFLQETVIIVLPLL